MISLGLNQLEPEGRVRYQVLEILAEVQELLDLDSNDLTCSGWSSKEEAKAEWGDVIGRFKDGSPDVISDIRMFFMPTGPLQEISFSGWSDRYLELATRMDKLIAQLGSAR
jgi:hypothetical protein